MIALLTGKLVDREGSRGVLDVRGVGYEVFAPSAALDRWGVSETDVVAHVYTQVAEDTLSLYGFESREERSAFATLLGVSGVGPKVALAALDALPVDALARAVEAGDFATLGRIKGVGKKTAQRLALELKGKLPMSFTPATSAQSAPSGDPLPLALDRLGYSKSEISRALTRLEADGLTPDDPMPVRIKAALALLSGART